MFLAAFIIGSNVLGREAKDRKINKSLAPYSARLSSNNWATLFVLQLKLTVIWGYSLYNPAFLFVQKGNEVLESVSGYTLYLWKLEKDLENCCL